MPLSPRHSHLGPRSLGFHPGQTPDPLWLYGSQEAERSLLEEESISLAGSRAPEAGSKHSVKQTSPQPPVKKGENPVFGTYPEIHHHVGSGDAQHQRGAIGRKRKRGKASEAGPAPPAEVAYSWLGVQGLLDSGWECSARSQAEGLGAKLPAPACCSAPRPWLQLPSKPAMGLDPQECPAAPMRGSGELPHACLSPAAAPFLRRRTNPCYGSRAVPQRKEAESSGDCPVWTQRREATWAKCVCQKL
ncbi:uncharacterized protein LOC123345007 isoform X2 [Mauremys mutica]|uniref:uncharacterized protein LOC123345007 isoform X2 n=1 Tax=Mauremys mutica TaxID=74926 RepID=UPI001D16B579|nr:uncharacterized protein LOC123345007 isoform X2 [Mauremys mutica]